MPALHLSCFQSAQAWLDGKSLTNFSRVKAQALLIYLAVEQERPHRRDALAGLFWPDSPETRARRNLSQTLMELRRTLGDAGVDHPNEPSFLLATNQTITFNSATDHWIDVTAFEAAIAADSPDYAQAVELYRGPFLADFDVPDSDLFETWVLTQRENLHRWALDAFRKLSLEHEQQGELEQARQVVNRLLVLAPWQEEAHAQLMRLLALSGERTAALAQYDTLSQMLMDELGVSPSEETDQLYDQILAGEIGGNAAPQIRPAAVALPSVPAPPEPANPPLIGTFVGRQQELAHYAEQLLLNNVAIISGMAGVGKTALAVALAERWQTQSLDEGTAAALFQRVLTDTTQIHSTPLHSTQINAPANAKPTSDQPGKPLTTDSSPMSSLAQEEPRKKRVFWHRFHTGEGMTTLLWKLAAFLAWHGQTELWQQLQMARQTGSEPPQPTLLFDYVLQMLRGQGYLLCLDNLPLLDDPLLSLLIARLQTLLAQGELALIITTRQLPDFLDFVSVAPLMGMTQPDIEQLAAARGLFLQEEWSANLYTHTEGNAQLVILAFNVLERATDPARALALLAEADDIERYLTKEVDDRLSEDEREVLIAVSVLLGYPADREIIECVSEQRRLKRILRNLTDRHLLIRSQSGEQDTYHAHTIVRAYYYDLPSRRELRAMHQRAAAYYEEEMSELFQATRHFERAGAHDKAATLATRDVWGLINQGKAHAMQQLLARLADHQLELEISIKVNMAYGQVCRFLGNSDEARVHYQAALSRFSESPDLAHWHELQGEIALGMGEALRNTSPTAALEWLERGLAELLAVEESEGQLPEACEQLVAALQIRIGNLHWTLSRYELAMDCTKAGLTRLSPHPSQWRALAFLTLGNVYDVQGHKEQARSALQESLAISRQLHDTYWMIVATSILGINLEIAGDWPAAAIHYQQALALAEQTGNLPQSARVENSLGLLGMKRGDDEEALTLLTHALELNRKLGIERELPYVLGSLAQVQIQRQEWVAATKTLAEAEEIAANLKTRYPLVEVNYLQAQVALAQDQLPEAYTLAEAAIQLADELESIEEAAIAQRVRGMILVADKQPEAALTEFAKSFTRLADRDPYEAARTQLAWGQTLMTIGNMDEGYSLLQEAQQTFERLGAQRELTQLASLSQMLIDIDELIQ
ncbi:tetratricopeptide repeat protein [Chloroflexi bacterium TSY]|nr:tetratricopeptide repeat protein [Chloroflexi bacterium TSY]